MQPTSALALSYQGITLYARQADNRWLSLGAVKLNDPDLSGALSDLVGEAVAHGGTQFSTLLILPSDQLLFTEATVTSEAAAAAEIAAQLEGRTPYEVSDLVYDWSGSGATRKVAAVAIETLAEAEAFAEEYGFHPVAFSAVVPEGAFEGQPFLGECAGAEARLAGASVAREIGPFRVTKTALDVPEAKNGAKQETKPEPKPEPKPEAKAAPGPTPPTFSSRRPAQGEGRDGTGVGAADRLSRITPRLNHPSPTLSAPAADDAAQTDSASASVQAPAPAPPKPPLAAARATAPPAPPKRPDFMDAVAPGPALDGALAAAAPRSSSRLGMWLTLGLLIILLLIGALSLFAVPPGSVGRWFETPPAEQEIAAVEQSIAAVAPEVTPQAPAPLESAAFDLLPDTADAFLPEGGSFSAVALAPLPNELAPEPEPGTIALAEDVTTPLSAPPMDAADVVLDAEALLPSEDDVIREEQAALPLPNALQIVETYAASGIWIGTPDAPEPAPEDAIQTLYQTNLDAPIAHADAVALPTPAEQLASIPPRTYLPPPPPGTSFAVDERGLVVPTQDGIITPDGVAVIAGAPPVDVLPDPRPTPPAEARTAAEVQDTDAAPSPEEAQATQRALLALIPPTPRPANFAETVERVENNGLTLAELRTPGPQPRPQSLQAQAEEEARLANAVAAAAAQAAQQASLASPGGSSGAAPATTPGGIAIGRTAEPPLRVTPQSDSALAIARSTAPRLRPADAAQRVARIEERTQTRATASAASGASVASVAPRATSQAAPSTTRTLPPGGSVARAATDTNALRLRQINLIGVFGKPSEPKALIRLRNGRTVRVGVGDRVDNGRVTSIGNGRLTYRRGSRDMVLEMPRI